MGGQKEMGAVSVYAILNVIWYLLQRQDSHKKLVIVHKPQKYMFFYIKRNCLLKLCYDRIISIVDVVVIFRQGLLNLR